MLLIIVLILLFVGLPYGGYRTYGNNGLGGGLVTVIILLVVLYMLGIIGHGTVRL